MKDIYFFEDGNKEMAYILGRKGANLSEMYNVGLPIPYGFILPINSNIQHIQNQIEKSILKLDGTFGVDLFVSVRSGAVDSMPGMMDSILNVGSYEELYKSIDLVLNSWNNRRAKIYREKNNIPHENGTAVVIQKMVFGNKNKDSASGVIFSRNPNKDVKGIVGEILFNTQGDKIVSGTETPQQINLLQSRLPQNYLELESIASKLEEHFEEIQEIEFTIEDKKLFILQTRNVKKRSKIEKYKIESKTCELINTGIAASYGSAVGKIVFDTKKAIDLKQKGEDVILLRPETSPNDIDGIIACNGIITLQGGATSHAAVIARSLGKPCVCGCKNLNVKEFDWVTINGETGEIFLGKEKLIKISEN